MLVLCCLISLSLLLTMLAATAKCCIHIHKYWCSCQTKPTNTSTFYLPQPEMTVINHCVNSEASNSPASGCQTCARVQPAGLQASEPASQDKLMLVQAVPPCYSTFSVTCDNSSCSNAGATRLEVPHRTSSHTNHGSEPGNQCKHPVRSHSHHGNTVYKARLAHGSQSVPANLTLVPQEVLGERIHILVPSSSGRDRTQPPPYASIFQHGGCDILIEDTEVMQGIKLSDICIENTEVKERVEPSAPADTGS